MDEETVDVVLSNPWTDEDGKDHKVGARLELAIPLAKKLVRAGYAVYPTKDDALDAEGEAGTEKTARAVRKHAGSG